MKMPQYYYPLSVKLTKQKHLFIQANKTTGISQYQQGVYSHPTSQTPETTDNGEPHFCVISVPHASIAFI